jgi:pyridoxal phosphate enzyme (YggS family)
VNIHSTGSLLRRRCFTARPQASNRSSMPVPTSIASSLSGIHARIAAAASAAGRDPDQITLVAVSKTHPASAIAEAIAAGQNVFGENRVQEAEQKFPALLAAHPHSKLHLIGGLQSNKAAAAVRLAHCIETLDRPKLADAIAIAVQAAGTSPTLLVQVNIGDEPQKSGIPTADADVFIRAMRARFGDALQGLMCIPPADRDPMSFFRHLVQLADTHGLPVRSMGMSADFETAIAAGATHIRVGSAIFGNRQVNPPGD